MTFAVGDSVRFNYEGLRGSGIILRYVMSNSYVMVRLNTIDEAINDTTAGWPSPHDGPGVYWNVPVFKLQATTTALGNSYE